MKINEENQFDWINRYLENELSAEEQHFFEQEKSRNLELASLVNRQQEAQKILEKTLAENHYRQRATDLLKENTNFLNLIHQEQTKVATIRSRNMRYWQMVAAGFVGLLALAYCLFYYSGIFKSHDEFVENPEHTINPKITKKPDNETKDSAQNKKIIKPQITENQPMTQEKTNRNLRIEEWILRKSMGFSGTNDIEKTSRPMLILAKSPLEKPFKNQILYRLGDTLKVFGAQNIESMHLLYRENLGKYYLVLLKDTFPLNYRDKKWQVLKKD